MSVAFLLSGLFIMVMGLGDMGVVTLPLIGWCLGAFILGLMGSGESVPYGYLLQSERNTKAYDGKGFCGGDSLSNNFNAHCTSNWVSIFQINWSKSYTFGSRRSYLAYGRNRSFIYCEKNQSL